jgi:hypothetical protein
MDSALTGEIQIDLEDYAPYLALWSLIAAAYCESIKVAPLINQAQQAQSVKIMHDHLLRALVSASQSCIDELEDVDSKAANYVNFFAAPHRRAFNMLAGALSAPASPSAPSR